MHGAGIIDNCDDDSSGHHHHIPPSPPPHKAFLVHHHEQHEYQQQDQVEEGQTSTEEEELFVTMGNAAKAARRVGILQQQQRLRTTRAEAKTDTETTGDDPVGYMGRNATNARTNMNTTAYYMNGYGYCADDGEVCYTTNNTSTATTLTTVANADSTLNEKKNETCTLMNGSSIIPATTTTTTTTTTGGGVVDDDDKDDYVVGNYGEEEVRAYKTSGTATLSQSEHIVQQQQQQQEQGVNALISNVGLFLDQTWNWLHYFFVTIIFLNLVHFANRRESVVGEDRSVVGEVVGANIEKEEQSEEEGSSSSLESEESGNFINCNTTSVVIDINNSTLLEKSTSSKEETMSPNTCSIQNQEEVEKAEEAIMAVGVGNPSEEKAVVTEAAAVVAPVIVTTKPIEENIAEENESDKQQEQQQQQITIILPSADQVVVEDASSTSDDNTSENGIAGIRRDSVDSYTSSEGSGNLGDIEAEICDKSSEDGTASITSGNADDENTGKQIAQKIISQVETMFSDEHLSKDGFLLKHVRRRSDGFVSLKLVAGLRKVKQISREFPVVLNALKDSSKLEINSEGTKVRRVEPLTSFLKSVPIKSKDKESSNKGSKDGSSNDENQLPSATMHQNNKSPSKAGNKENSNNENGNGKQGGGSRRNSNVNNGNQSRRNSNAQGSGNPHHRKSSNTSSTSSNNSSRHNSFSKAPGAPSSQHPADLFRNVYMAAYNSSSGDENQSPQVGRRRGGSLPIAAMHRASNGAYLSPNSSPPNGTLIIGPNGARPKSNSYCEGASPTTMSPWLQRRKASASSRLSNGELTFSGVLRQPRGPDGTKGFATGYRAMILEERLQQQQSSAVSA